MIEIRSGDREAAFDVPFNAYPEDSPYVSPMKSDVLRLLDPNANPLVTDGHGRFELFTAHRAGRPVGRILACIHDGSNKRHNTKAAQFGFFDCGDDEAVADALLQRAEDWARGRGADTIAGNFNLTAMQMIGVVTEGFEHTPYTDMIWTPPYLITHLERRGYRRTFPMATHETDLKTFDPETLLGPKQRAILTDPAFSWKKITRRTFRRRMEEARALLNEAFDPNPMFVPVTAEEYHFQAGEMMWIMDTRLPVLVHHEGKPAGVVVTIPDLNPFVRASGARFSWAMPLHFVRHRLNRKRAVSIYNAVSPRLQGRGLNSVMQYKLITAAKKSGYTHLGGTWIGDVNGASLKQMEYINARPLHRLHLFSRPLREDA